MPAPAGGVRGPCPTKNPSWAGLWPGFFLMYRSLFAPLKLSLAPYLLDSGAGTDRVLLFIFESRQQHDVLSFFCKSE